MTSTEPDCHGGSYDLGKVMTATEVESFSDSYEDDDNSVSHDSQNTGSDVEGEAAVAAFRSLASYGRNAADDEPKSPSSKTNKKRAGGVKFGSVRVHTHKLTLGANPGGKSAGPPVELAWNHQESLRFSTIDDFAIEEHGLRDSLVIHDRAHLITPAERQKIAAREHTPGSIRKIQMQVHEIRKERLESKKEDPLEAEKKDAARRPKKIDNDENKDGTKKGVRGFFKNLFA